MSTSADTNAATSPIITARSLRKSYGEVEAVKDLSFEVAPGRILGLLGPNGAGKTTTVQMLATLVSIDAGTATVGGFDVATQPDQVRRLIGMAGQSAAALLDALSEREDPLAQLRLLRLHGRGDVQFHALKTDERHRAVVAELDELASGGEFHLDA